MKSYRHLLGFIPVLLFTVYGPNIIKAKGARNLILDRVEAPSYVLIGESAELYCHYNLGHEQLYSITWSKDYEEFYRFVPKDTPSQHVYHVVGARFDRHRSDDKRIMLRDLNLKATGMYRCEVSAEAPSFTSVQGEALLEVIALPIEDPKIGGFNDVLHRFGDVITLNCTAGESSPPAYLSWYVNSKQVNPESEIVLERGDRFRTVSSINITIKDFSTIVRCVSTAGPTPLTIEERRSPPLDTREDIVFVRSWALRIQASWIVIIINNISLLLRRSNF